VNKHRQNLVGVATKLRTSKARNSVLIAVKVKVKFTLEQAMKVHRGSRGIALLFL
jgi:hypothetical protein